MLSYFLEKNSNSLYGFLLESSAILSDYRLSIKKLKNFIDVFNEACSNNSFFISMKNSSSLVAADEKTRLIIRVTQDFLYGLNEIACQNCACETVSHDQKEKMVTMMIQKYAQRIISFCDLTHFEQSLPVDCKELFIEGVHDLLKKLKSKQEVYELLQAFHDRLDKNLVIQAYVFVNYISCL